MRRHLVGFLVGLVVTLTLPLVGFRVAFSAPIPAPGTAPSTDGGGGTSGDGGSFAGAFVEVAQSQLGLPYVWDGGTFTGPSGIGSDGRGPGFDCSGLVLYAAYQASGGRVRLTHYTGDQINETQPIAWDSKAVGDIIFYTYAGASAPHHVVIYLGGDQILEAPQTGQNVRYGSLSEFPGQTASVRRINVPQ